MKKNSYITIFIYFFILAIFPSKSFSASSENDLLKVKWSFLGITGKFDRGSLQRGYQVYQEVCSSCHSMKYLSYRNLGEKGGPEFTLDEVKAIASNFEVTDGPNSEGEMFTRPGRPSDHFVSPYPNVNASMAANGGAYPPDMSVLVKARPGGANYIYSVLMGYEDPPAGLVLDDGVYYNKYMIGNKIKMSKPLNEGLVEYSDGTQPTVDQMAKDVTTFLTWTAEPHLEARHKTGTKVIIYLIILATLVYFSMKRLWSRVDSEE
jgi:ubiquinol-cytochrome c reductase cytochrome c1 subunit